MAFQSAARNTTPASSTNDDWKAAGFINASLTLPGQATIKLPSLALKNDKYADLIKWLNEDPTRVAKLLPYITFDYKANTPTAKVFDFSALS